MSICVGGIKQCHARWHALLTSGQNDGQLVTVRQPQVADVLTFRRTIAPHAEGQAERRLANHGSHEATDLAELQLRVQPL